MRQDKPYTVAGTIYFGQRNVSGLTRGIVPTRLVTAADYEPALAALNAAHADATLARSVKRHAQMELDRLVAESRAFISQTDGLLGGVFGRRFSAAWTPLGFVRNLRVPWTHAGREDILRSTASYLEAHPELQSVPCGVTALRARELSDAYTAALNVVQRAVAEVRARRKARDAAMKAVLKLINDLLHELATALTPR